ncbi:MAG: rod shape-determining protein MreD [Proteobacteria bacterium]|nr:rod shape-determining protein MreD [Pseudomonadota bacterium]
MDEFSTSRLWLMRVVFCVLGLVILFFQLLPLSTLPGVWAGPDLLIALACAWAVRRPDYVPGVAVAAVILVADLLLYRVPGLLALLVVLGTHTLKLRSSGLRDAGFAGEWTAVAIVILGIALCERLLLTILMVEQPPLGLALSHAVMTVVIYPVMVGVSHVLFGVQRLSPGDEDALGGRL